MTGSVCLGLDTSNYTTSVAVFDGRTGKNYSRLLDVPTGALGLRQSEALFQHVKHLPALFDKLRKGGLLTGIEAVGASTRPRAVEGSYMPCFLAGDGQARILSDALGVPFFSCSHQQGHLAAAAWSAGRTELLEAPFLAWHLSGGTTELLLVEPGGIQMRAEKIGGTSDISAGQLIDRTGVLLGMDFPCGRALDALYGQADADLHYQVKLDGLFFSLSGMENKVKSLVERGESAANIARFAQNTIAGVVRRVTDEALQRYPGLPILCSGGVASNARLRMVLREAVFAEPGYSTDNAMGVAILAWSALHGKEVE